jgi:hypothetical protein
MGTQVMMTVQEFRVWENTQFVGVLQMLRPALPAPAERDASETVLSYLSTRPGHPTTTRKHHAIIAP